ncbi:hypothetical protein OsJ_24397 [Oryza sativa Japonica Group]|uniref:Phosphoadenosine phosphosulphate reductase domain-containing protein n=1 Tax=Oryza sativa subsp. japonica TaxID=39947 RepID=B9FXF9_ORYSJ|nr:hypothetical protein OsJ_24397 [Oryza sativa Japonica Group]
MASLDTGRLNPETYQLFDKVEKHYGIRIEYMFPDAGEVQALVRAKGLFSFYEDGHQECCRARKVRPLRRALRGLRAWITGQRKDQSPGTRAAIPVVQVDPSFEGLAGGAGSLVKWNPVANVDGKDFWTFLRAMDVPVNALHAQGYVSIGVRAVHQARASGQHEREGRWWWEDAKAKECGLHKGNIDDQGGAAAAAAHKAGGANGNGSAGAPDIFESSGVAMEASYLELAERLGGAGGGVKVGKFRADGEQKAFAQQELQLQSFPTILLFPSRTARPIKYPSEKRDVDSLLAFVNSLR